jgi:hypothetical protein
MLKVILVLLLTVSNVYGKNKMLEKEYQEVDCKQKRGKTEYPIEGGRVDCLTKSYAIEYDFAKKWADCLGQTLYYSAMTNKIGICTLIVEDNIDYKYVRKLEEAINYHQIYIGVDVIKNLN